MQVKDLIVNGDARIIGNLYTKDGLVGGGAGGSGSDGGGGLTYTLSKSGSTITLRGSDGSVSSVTDSDTTATPYSLPLAANGVRGGVQIGYSQNGKNYPVQLSGEKMYVNVPWTDTNTTYSNASQSAAGLMSATDKAKLDGIATGANNYTLTKAAVISALGYTPPTTDTNTTYSAGTGLTLSGTQFKLPYNPVWVKMELESDLTNFSDEYNSFCPFFANTTTEGKILFTGTATADGTGWNTGTDSELGQVVYNVGNSLTIEVHSLGISDSRYKPIYCVRIGDNVNYIRLNATCKYKNSGSSSTQIHTYLWRYTAIGGPGIQDRVAVGSSLIGAGDIESHNISTVLKVSKGDAFYVSSYKGTAARDIDMYYLYGGIQFSVEAIG